MGPLDLVLWEEYERIWEGKNRADGESDNGRGAIEEFARTFENYYTRVFKENLRIKEKGMRRCNRQFINILNSLGNKWRLYLFVFQKSEYLNK